MVWPLGGGRPVLSWRGSVPAHGPASSFLKAAPFEPGVVMPGEMPPVLIFFGTCVGSMVGGAAPSGRLRGVCEVGPIAVNVDSCRRRRFSN